MIKKLLALLLSLQFIFPMNINASFEDLGAGARAPGMADVFVGVADNADTATYNPAGLARLENDELSMQYGQLLKGNNDGSSLGTTYLAAVHRLRKGKFGTLGFAYNNFRAQSLFSERTLTLSYGWKLKVMPFGLEGLWSMGTNLKQLHHQYEPDRYTENALNDAGGGSGQVDPIFAKNGYAKDVYSVDWGALYQFGTSNRITAGLSLININQPDVSLNNDGDTAPFISKFGLSYRYPWGLAAAELRRTSRADAAADTDIAFALERNFRSTNSTGFSVRGGYASGSRNYKAMTAGLSYAFSRARLDYAFNFPVSTLSDSQGSHRLGLSVYLGEDKWSQQPEPDSSASDLLISFSQNPKAAHLSVVRAYEHMDPPTEIQTLLLQLLVNRYPMDENTSSLHRHLNRLSGKSINKILEWPEVKSKLIEKYPADDQANINNTLDVFAKGDPEYTLARLALLTPASRQLPSTKILTLVAHAEIAAKAYRMNSLDPTIDHVRQMMDIIPDDTVIVDGYRKLLLMKTRGRTEEPMVNKTSLELPDAPVALTQPTPVDGNKLRNSLTEMDAVLRGYGSQMGYYFSRKAEGAAEAERRILLEQIRSLYGNKGIDLGLLNRELAQLQETPVIESKPAVATVPVVSATPTRTPAVVLPPEPKQAEVKLAPTPLPAAERRQVVAKYKIARKTAIPIIASSPELSTALTYYRKAVERGISDPERIEILESIVIRFGEAGGVEISKELDRIRKRVQAE